jgi:hypothetical protein
MRAQASNRVRLAAARAAEQHGNVTAKQLLGLGWSRSAIDRWHAKGLLHREFRGVYRFGHRSPSWEARALAAVLACGDGALLSGRAAAYLFSLILRPPPLEVTAPTERRLPGVRTRRRPVMRGTVWRSIPATTLTQTIVDLAPLLSLDALALACHRAGALHGLRAPAVPAGAPGAAKLRLIYQGDHPTLLSRLEREFRRALRRHGLPLPRTNVHLEEGYVDCRWPRHRLTVELDSFRFHNSRASWERDRERERAARARGDAFRRYTWRDVVEQPLPMLADLAALLGVPVLDR